MSHVDPTKVQDIWFIAQRVLRTGVQVAVSGALVLGTIVIIAPQVLEAVQDVLPGPVVAWLAGAIATLTAVSAALSRVMAVPAVNAWLTGLGLGSVPRSEATK